MVHIFSLEELMKQVVYGTVSALALMLAVTGAAKADDVQAALGVSATSNEVSGNYGVYTAIFGDNEIDQQAFQNAKGAFNVGQNESINSAVQQSMAIAAIVNTDSSDTVVGKGETNQLGLAVSLGYSRIEENYAIIDLVSGHNELEDQAFQNAAGAFNVLQNHSLNSGVSQSMAIGAVLNNDGDRDASPFDSSVSVAVSALSAEVTGNTAAGVLAATFSNTNRITDQAFQNAKGAFNVLQNNSVNSAVQQSMAIGAVVNRAN
ncbi:MAG TPA: hypothetical protein VGU20_21485 [Stellaceae bacterium]|nr:hypothetical protein [Stellaceae bacterium]